MAGEGPRPIVSRSIMMSIGVLLQKSLAGFG